MVILNLELVHEEYGKIKVVMLVVQIHQDQKVIMIFMQIQELG